MLLADDVFVVGPLEAAAAAFNDYRMGVAAADGAVNMPKCIAWSPTDAGTQHLAIH